MNKLIEIKLKECYHNLSQVSIKSYATNISKVLSLIKSDNIEDIYIKYNDIISILKDKYVELNTRKIKMSSCIALIKCLMTSGNTVELEDIIKKYNFEIDIIKSELGKKLRTNIKSVKEESSWITDEESKKIDTHLTSLVPKKITDFKDFVMLRNLVIFRFYNELASRNEVADTKLIFDGELDITNKDYNYIILYKKDKSVKYIMNQYKTSKSHGTNIVKLSKPMYSLLLKYKKNVEQYSDDRWFLLNDMAKAKLTRNRLGIIYSSLGEVIGKQLSTRTNRHISVSDTINIGAVKDLARRMGHSVSEAVYTYAKI